MTEKQFIQETGRFVYVGNFSELRKQVGFRKSLKSLIVRYRYIVRLWILRECKIIMILSENYDQVPKWTVSRFLARIYLRSALVRKLTGKIANLTQQKLISNF